MAPAARLPWCTAVLQCGGNAPRWQASPLCVIQLSPGCIAPSSPARCWLLRPLAAAAPRSIWVCRHASQLRWRPPSPMPPAELLSLSLPPGRRQLAHMHPLRTCTPVLAHTCSPLLTNPSTPAPAPLAPASAARRQWRAWSRSTRGRSCRGRTCGACPAHNTTHMRRRLSQAAAAARQQLVCCARGATLPCRAVLHRFGSSNPHAVLPAERPPRAHAASRQPPPAPGGARLLRASLSSCVPCALRC